jgi:hypothetical protein
MFKVFSGPFFKSIEAKVYALPYFIKHVPVPDRPALISAMEGPGRRYISTDFTAFESHFTPEVLEAVELRLYRYMLGNRKETEVICSTIAGVNHGRTRQGVSFEVRGRRMSGDMCTSLGNGFTNLMLWSYLCSLKRARWEGFVEGDDGIFAIIGECPTVADYKRLGFTIKMEEHDSPQTASFCGVVAADNVVIREPVEFLANFGWSSSFISSGRGKKLSLLRAKSLSAAYETPSCPIIGAFARRGLELTRGVRPHFVSDGYHNAPPDEFNIPDFAPTDKVRVLFARLFHIPVATQLRIEQYVMSHGDMYNLLDETGLGRLINTQHYSYWLNYTTM